MKGTFREVVVSTSVNERGYVVNGHILEYYEKPMKRSSEFKHLEKGGYFLPNSTPQQFIKSVEDSYRSYLEQILNKMKAQ